MAKAKTAAVPQPTFAECKAEYWDEENNRPDCPSPDELEDWDVMQAAKSHIASVHRWLGIQEDPAEAHARAEYAAHAALYLSGIFPHARVNGPSFAAAAGEELGRFSADIVKMIAERARRTSKTLPSIAQMLEWADAEHQRRTAQSAAYIRALAAREMALEQGRRRAASFVEQAAKAGLVELPTEADLLTIHESLADGPLGIEPKHSAQRLDRSRKVHRLYGLIGSGSAEAAHFAIAAGAELQEVVQQAAAASAAVDEAGCAPVEEQAERNWRAASDAQDQAVDTWQRRLEALLAGDDARRGQQRSGGAYQLAGAAT
jgi:DNA-binding FrmR family transcriptional regulator